MCNQKPPFLSTHRNCHVSHAYVYVDDRRMYIFDIHLTLMHVIILAHMHRAHPYHPKGWRVMESQFDKRCGGQRRCKEFSTPSHLNS